MDNNDIFKIVKAQNNCLDLLGKRIDIMSQIDDNIDARLQLTREEVIAMRTVVEMILERMIPDEKEREKFCEEARKEVTEALKET